MLVLCDNVWACVAVGAWSLVGVYAEDDWEYEPGIEADCWWREAGAAEDLVIDALRACTNAVESWREGESGCWSLCEALNVAERATINLTEAMLAKDAKNKKRGRLHGKVEAAG